MPKLDIDTDYIAKLAELLQRTGLTEIEISEGDARVRVAKKVRQVVEMQAPAASGPRPAAAQPEAPVPAAAPDQPHPGTINSPMVGTVYLASEPGAANFVNVGDEVKEGQTLLIIEAMKVMNSIRAPKSGRVTQIFVENATPVEFGEPLLVIE